MAAKVKMVEPLFVRPAPRGIISLRPEDVPEFLNTRELDFFRVFHTPELAKICLERNREDNRAVSRHTLSQISRDMGHGTNVQFLENGDTIRFDWNGYMFDGQKRNRGVITSDTPQVLTWAIGLNPEAHFVTDKGQKRRLADSLKIAGYKNYSVMAAAAVWLYIIKYCNEPTGFVMKQRLGSDEEVYTLIRKHPDLVRSIAYCVGCRPGKRKDLISRGQLIPVGLVSVIHYLATNFLGKEEEAAGFANTIAKYSLPVPYPHAVDNGPKLYNPASVWLKWLDERKKADVYISREIKGTGTIQAWNLYSAGRKIEKLKLSNYAAITGLDLDRI